jgi:hypothetical protein
MDKYVLTRIDERGNERHICWSNNFNSLVDLAYDIDNKCVEKGYKIYELVEKKYERK